jgi:excinuclease ABC subunit C
MPTDAIRSKVGLAPQSPGVYLFKDDSGAIVYVGKAANLHNRVTSYFGSKSGLSTKVVRMVGAICDIEYMMAGSEQEALVLEADLIKRYRPQYNARLKDDKSFPFLKVDVGAEWPTVSVTRRKLADGAEYFGPFASAKSMHQTLRLIRKVFRFRVCSGPLERSRSRACLNMHIGLCPGPCIGAITREEYGTTIDRIVLFLHGKYRDVLESMNAEMKDAAACMQFERAALLRDRIQAVELVTERYGGVTALRGDQDILAVAQDAEVALVDVFSVRGGRVLGRQTFPVENTQGLLPSDVLRSFILGYYPDATSVPPLLMLQYPVSDSRLIAGWLSELRGGAVRLTVPRTGIRRQLLSNVADGVARQLVALRSAPGPDPTRREAGLKQLKEALGLGALPHRIEGFDISTTQGSNSVGSMVVFQDGVAKPSEYRRFKIRTVVGQDDFAMMYEVVRRRLNRMHCDDRRGDAGAAKWSARPSLILVDGGRGQLNAALTAREGLDCSGITIVGLAKEYETVYMEGRVEPANLERDSPGLLLLQAVRDEAHRFAVTYHRNVRGASGMTSLLDGVPGIGPHRKRAVLIAYESIDALRAADADDIARRSGIPLAMAEGLKQRLASVGT